MLSIANPSQLALILYGITYREIDQEDRPTEIHLEHLVRVAESDTDISISTTLMLWKMDQAQTSRRLGVPYL